jgi:hypothetical protein
MGIEVAIERMSLAELRVIMFNRWRVGEAKLPVTGCYSSFLKPVVKGKKCGILSG